MKNVLDLVSIIGSFLVVFGLLFLIQDFTIGRIDGLKDVHVFNFFAFKDILFTATSLLFILKFIDFYIPDRN